MKMGFVGLGIFLSTILSGCADINSSQVSPSAIYSSYGANYDEATNKIHFTATFTVGGALGTYVQLDSKSSVSVDNNQMSMDQDIFDQITYVYDIDASSDDLSLPHTFVYIDDSGNVYQNNLSVPAEVGFQSSQPQSASIESGLLIYWNSASPVGNYDQLTVNIQGQLSSTVVQANTDGTSGVITVSPTDLQTLGSGGASAQLCLTNSSGSIRGTSEGGDKSSSYCSTPVSITVTP